MATMMPSLPGQPVKSPDGFSRILLMGTSLIGGGSLTYMVVQLIRDEPDRAFKLLGQWGPGFLLAAFIGLLVSRLMDKMLDGSARQAESSASAIRDLAAEVRSVAEATSRQAAAVQMTAEKSDSVTQEMQILIGVVNNKVEMALDEQKRGNRALERIENALKINQPESEK